jgi:hypothetical protein
LEPQIIDLPRRDRDMPRLVQNFKLALLTMEPGDKRRAGQTSVAASIKFDIVPKGKDDTPEILSDGKSIVTPLLLHTLDGQACDALLRHPAATAVSDARLVVMVHGSGSSHKQAPQADLGDRLAARGFASLAFDGRACRRRKIGRLACPTARMCDASEFFARQPGRALLRRQRRRPGGNCVPLVG